MPELTGTLDTSVNGPEGLPSFDGGAWDRVDWRFHEEQVRRLRGRIFKAVQEGDWPLARNLQKLDCATRRPVVSPAQPGGIRREIPGPDALPGTERGREPQHGRKLMVVSRRKERRIRRPARQG